MCFIHHQHYFNLRVYIQKPLHIERVSNILLLAFVVLESRAVVECDPINNNFCWDGSFRVFLVADFGMARTEGIESWLQSIIFDNKLISAEEIDDSAFADSSIANHEHSLLILVIKGDLVDS